MENPSIQHLWPIWQVLFPPNAAIVGGRPVVSLTLAINYALGGMNVWGYHAVNLAIHILAAWTLFGVMRRTLILPRLRERFGSAATPLALAAAMLWMVHPLQTESVTYVIQRTEALVGLFYLLDALLRHSRGNFGLVRRCWYIAAAMACLLGMATKEVMVTAPLIVLLYDRTFLGRLVSRGLAATLGLVSGLGRHLGRGGVVVDFNRLSRRHHRLCRAEVHLVVVPADATGRDRPLPSAGVLARGPVPGLRLAGAHAGKEVLLPGILVVGLLGLTVWALVKRPAWGFLGRVVLRDPCADLELRAHQGRGVRASHVPAVGGGGGRRGDWRLRCRPDGLSVGGGFRGRRRRSRAVSLVMLARRGTRNPHLPAQRGLPERVVDLGRHGGQGAGQRASPQQPRFALARRGRVDEAIAHYRKALEINPDFAEAHNNLGLALADRGRFDEAIAYYQKALEIKPDYAEAHNNLGTVLAGTRLDEAITEYRKALETKPDFAEAHYNLGLSWRITAIRSGDHPVREGSGSQARFRRHITISWLCWRLRTSRRGHRPLPEGPGDQARLRRGPQQPRRGFGRWRQRRGHHPLPEGPGDQARLRGGPQ